MIVVRPAMRRQAGCGHAQHRGGRPDVIQLLLSRVIMYMWCNHVYIFVTHITFLHRRARGLNPVTSRLGHAKALRVGRTFGMEEEEKGGVVKWAINACVCKGIDATILQASPPSPFPA